VSRTYVVHEVNHLSVLDIAWAMYVLVSLKDFRQESVVGYRVYGLNHPEVVFIYLFSIADKKKLYVLIAKVILIDN